MIYTHHTPPFFTAPSDYAPITQELIFQPGQPVSACVTLAVVDDSILEDTEDLFFALTSADEAVLFSRNLTRIFILNADGICSEHQ